MSETETKAKAIITLQGDAYHNFIDSLKSHVTVASYEYSIKKYLQFLQKTDIND